MAEHPERCEQPDEVTQPNAAGQAPEQQDDEARRAELEAGLAAVHRRIRAACTDAARDPAEVTLVVVTKFFPVSDVRILADLGVHDVGENRDQEARLKLTSPTLGDCRLTRHFIGQLQTNKAGSVASYADVVHTVDRDRLATALGRAAAGHGRRVRALLQVDLDPDAEAHQGRGGVAPSAAVALAELVAQQESLELAGVMGVAPLGGDPDGAFERLREVAVAVGAEHPGATWVSAGMSGDLEAAVRRGATHLRVGSAILGSRPALR